jgi:hypothetical protein
MYDVKSFLASRTLIAAFIALAAWALAFFKVTDFFMDPGIQARLVENLFQFVQALAIIAAMIFRVKATNRLT